MKNKQLSNDLLYIANYHAEQSQLHLENARCIKLHPSSRARVRLSMAWSKFHDLYRKTLEEAATKLK